MIWNKADKSPAALRLGIFYGKEKTGLPKRAGRSRFYSTGTPGGGATGSGSSVGTTGASGSWDGSGSMGSTGPSGFGFGFGFGFGVGVGVGVNDRLVPAEGGDGDEVFVPVIFRQAVTDFLAAGGSR